MTISESAPDQAPLLPNGHFPGFKIDQDLQLASAPELYGYMNGGAELYLSYGISRLRVLDLVDDSDRRILVEAYEFPSPEDAYGVYSFDSSGETVDVGQKATFSAGLLKFWKGALFCRILMIRDYETFREPILSAGRLIADRVEAGAAPELVGYLPQEGLLPNSAHYFYHEMVLNNLYYLSGRNPLGLASDVRAVLGRYRSGGDDRGSVLLIIVYPSVDRVAEAVERFKAEYVKEADNLSGSADGGLIVQPSEGACFGLRRSGSHLVLVFEAGNPSEAAGLLKRALAAIPVTADG